MDEVRVRFAPSPTGYLHIGGARTALYNWLFCRQRGGKFILRIEDTDLERSTEEATEAIFRGLRWLGIDWDEGPFYQRAHAEEHRAAAEKLIASGSAYPCYCTKGELDQKREAAQAAKADFHYDGTCRDLTPDERAEREAGGRSHVIRFRSPKDEGSVQFRDLIFGAYEVRHREIDDFVIVRSSGDPLYILSNVVDDHRDRISHVIRGADHLLNTTKQILLYRSLGWEVPTFAHIALTLDPQKAKISKRRHGEVVAVGFYEQAGFLPWAFCNFISLLGWSAGDDREVYLGREELLAAFNLDRVGRANSVFNYRKDDPKFITDPKALHINAQHIRQLPIEALAPEVERILQEAEIWQDRWAEGGRDRGWFLEILSLIRPRYTLLTDFVRFGRAFFDDDYPLDEKAAAKHLRKRPEIGDYLVKLAGRLEAIDPYTGDTAEETTRALADELEVKLGTLANAARVALTGQGVGPGIFEIMAALGQASTTGRLRRATTWL